MNTKKTLLLSLFAVLVAASASAKAVRLGWDYEPEPSVIGFTLSYWQEGAGEVQTVTVNPAEREATINVPAGRYGAHIVAVGNTGLSSDPGVLEGGIFIPLTPANLRIIIVP